VVGSEGVLGAITQVALRVRPVPALTRYEGWMFPSFGAGAEVLRRFEQGGLSPDVARLSDETETRMGLGLAGFGGLREAALGAYLRARGVAAGTLAILGWAGPEDEVRARRDAAGEALREGGGVALGQPAGRAWLRSRFSGPYLRDELMDRGVLAETLETATTWAQLFTLYGAVSDALREHAPLVACHISHLYPTGASLYYTFMARARRGEEIAQWAAAKAAASEAIVAAAGTITHHHAVGRDHVAYLEAEIGATGVAALRAVKRELDPAGVMNPGKLLP
jgi:alkyldihydroxyacetonephosphate synthase